MIVEPRRSRARACVYGLFNRVGETLPPHGAGPPGRERREGLARRRWSTRPAEVGRRGAARPGAAAGPGAVIDEHRARGPVARARHDDAVRPREAARRLPRLRRRGRHPLRRGATTAPTTARSTATSCGPTASSPRCASGPTSTASTLASSYFYSDSVYDTPLLSAVGHPVVGEPRPAAARSSRRRAAGLRSTSTCPPVSRSSSASSRSRWPWRSRGPSSCRTRGSTSPASSTSRSAARRSSSANHRSYFDITAMAMLFVEGGPARALPRQEGGLRRPGRRARSRRPSAASASTEARARTSR